MNGDLVHETDKNINHHSTSQKGIIVKPSNLLIQRRKRRKISETFIEKMIFKLNP